VEPQGFFLLSPGTPSNVRPELLGSERMASLLSAARETFDHIVVDCPPLGPVADSVILQDLVDGFLFVVRARHSPREAILKAISHLKPDRVRGTIFNDHRDVLPGPKAYGYHRYGEYR
jgi:Mrp family chromosome partitioning ATPase